MSEFPVVSHFLSTDLIQPLKEQPVSVHFKGTFQLRKFKSNPDLVALKMAEQNRFDRIPSPPVCGLDVMKMHRQMQKISPVETRVSKTRLYVRPNSMESKSCDKKEHKNLKFDTESEAEEINKICQEFSNQLCSLK
ncbi:uncharacterized protein LOC129764616 [Toxorhynchites rutilus septentrionalis]|uniref:uncharacterized protein LOC129764616 n=1 Tax=Toxorhynchites rutilus septentrionalis TaxID=329112 RepID=UPI00247A81E8|nr:uncharacterized protein LOC129764616 [Toxorhynchites rutilus septentrionalis]